VDILLYFVHYKCFSSRPFTFLTRAHIPGHFYEIKARDFFTNFQCCKNYTRYAYSCSFYRNKLSHTHTYQYDSRKVTLHASSGQKSVTCVISIVPAAAVKFVSKVITCIRFNVIITKKCFVCLQFVTRNADVQIVAATPSLIYLCIYMHA